MLVNVHNPGLLEQVPINISTANGSVSSEFNAYEFSESRGIVVANGLGVSESFQNWIRP